MPNPIPPLPDRLRDSTRDLHAAAERSGAMGQLLQGRLSAAGYRRLLSDLLALYTALEAALDANAAQPWLGGIPLAALRRGPALQRDLGDGAPPTPTPPARDYAERLYWLGAEGDPRLLAHVYTRYLGDLHGGQILQALVRRQFPAQPTHFMDFGDTATVRAHRQALRTALQAAPLAAAEADRVVDEARWSFEQHQRLFEALADG